MSIKSAVSVSVRHIYVRACHFAVLLVLDLLVVVCDIM